MPADSSPHESLQPLPSRQPERDDSRAGLGPSVDEIELARGTRLTREGVTGRELFVVVEGSADVFVDGQTVGTVGPGDVVGADALFDSLAPSAATVRANTPMRVLMIARTHLRVCRGIEGGSGP